MTFEDWTTSLKAEGDRQRRINDSVNLGCASSEQTAAAWWKAEAQIVHLLTRFPAHVRTRAAMLQRAAA